MSVLQTDLSNLIVADGRYTVREKLGMGSMGHVFRAFDTRLETEVVIKVPTDKRLADPEFHERFLQESKLLTQLSHPRIVKILDVGEHDGVPFFVMPYIDAGNLLDRMQDEAGELRGMLPLSLHEWLPGTAEALDFMHNKGYIHRDVKPANILFDTHGQVYLSDFGLSKILMNEDHESSGLTAANAVVGTPNYVAPELVLARKDYDGRADQYSLAVTVYEVLTGAPPFEGGSPMATMVNQTTKHPKLLHAANSDIPEELATAVRMAMSKRQWRRYESCTAFADAVMSSLHENTGSGINASSRSSSTGYSTVIEQRPEFVVAATSRGKNGVMPCPGCGEKIILKARYAGQSGSCVHCGGRLQISADLNELRLLKPLELNNSTEEPQPLTLADDQTPANEVPTSYRLFGFHFSSRLGMILTLIVLLLFLLAALLLGRMSATWSRDILPSVFIDSPLTEIDPEGCDRGVASDERRLMVRQA